MNGNDSSNLALAHAKLEADKEVRIAKIKERDHDIEGVKLAIIAVAAVLLGFIAWGIYAVYVPDQKNPGQERYELCVGKGMTWVPTNPEDSNAGACLGEGR